MKRYVAYFLKDDHTWSSLIVDAENMDEASDYAHEAATARREHGQNIVTWHVNSYREGDPV